jgi:very-short-patch-repair endonuclease
MELLSKETYKDSRVGSREIAERYGKQHKHVLESIRTLIKKNPELNSCFELQDYLSFRGRREPEYIINENGAKILHNKYKFNARSARFEVKFGNELKDYMNALGYEVYEQYCVCDNKYRIDFYFPKIKLAIEFDENEHKYKIENDIIRQNEIETNIGCKFIRINEYMTIGNALAQISKYINKVA